MKTRRLMAENHFSITFHYRKTWYFVGYFRAGGIGGETVEGKDFLRLIVHVGIRMTFPKFVPCVDK